MQDTMMARVVAVIGEAYAHNAIGELRVIAVGDVLLEGEIVLTPDDCEVQLELSDGSTLLVQESSHREIGSALLASSRGPDSQLMAGAAPVDRPAANDSVSFAELADGSVVQTRAGHNLFYNEKPLYWSVDAESTCACAIVHVSGDDGFVDHTAFALKLVADNCCSVTLGDGEFSVENHNVPFTTGDPEPGQPARFFGIADSADGKTDSQSGAEKIPVCAEVSSLGVTNNWYRDGEDIVFEFPGEGAMLADEQQESAAERRTVRAINNFTFQNTAQGPATFIARAYRDKQNRPVYEAGSESAPMRIAAGAVFCVISQLNYDRLVLTPVDCGDSCRRISLSLEGFSEFEYGDVDMTVGVQRGAVNGRFQFCIDQRAERRQDLQCVAEGISEPKSFDSFWEQLAHGAGLTPGDGVH